MGDDVIIKVEHVSKKFCKSLKRSMLYGIRDISKNMIGMSSQSYSLRKQEFWAVDDVSFEVKKGETLGIIGPNGSGKTTLLKMLNGIFMPDKGKITINGRVGALIAVGAGFHPMLTGRENVYVNAAILGMTKKEVDAKFNDIIDFADIGDFLDTPVKFYSSGMYVRLGFAVAIHCAPEILLIDEILAVGDIEFQNKCLNKLEEIRKDIATILVTHNMSNVMLICDKSIALVKGKIFCMGNNETVIENYSKMVFGSHEIQSKKYMSDKIEVTLLDNNNQFVNELFVHNSCVFRFKLKNLFIKKGLMFVTLIVGLSNNINYMFRNHELQKIKGDLDGFTFEMLFQDISLPPGEYTLRIVISDGTILNRVAYEDMTIIFHIKESTENRFIKPELNVFESNK